MKFILPLLFALAFSSSNAQVSQDTVKKQEPFTFVETMPVFPGGEQAFIEYIASNTVYPQQAKDNDIEGTVYVKFIVEASGEVTNVQVVKGTNAFLDAEALRVIQQSPKWTPGTQNGVAVPVYKVVPIRFVLSDDQPIKKKKRRGCCFF